MKIQINGGEIHTCTAGQHFTELPDDRRSIGANAIDTEPSRPLAVFVADTADSVLTIPDRAWFPRRFRSSVSTKTE